MRAPAIGQKGSSYKGIGSSSFAIHSQVGGEGDGHWRLWELGCEVDRTSGDSSFCTTNSLVQSLPLSMEGTLQQSRGVGKQD